MKQGIKLQDSFRVSVEDDRRPGLDSVMLSVMIGVYSQNSIGESEEIEWHTERRLNFHSIDPK
jgi:hypothetical protein